MIYYYSAIVAVGGSVVLFLLWRYIAKVRGKRIDYLRDRPHVTPILTDSPVKEPRLEFKAEGEQNISSNFSIISRSLTVVIVTVVIILSIIPFLNQVPATILSVFTGSLAIVVGIISKPFIENYIAGVIIGFNKNFKIGDTILMDDHYGTIEDITLTSTIVKLWDWRRVVIPNARMLNKEVINYTLHDNFIWMKVEFRVAYDTNLKQLRSLAVKSAQESAYFVKFENPAFWIMQLDHNNYKCWLAAWSDSPAKAWELGNDVRTKLIEQFQELGIKSHGFHVDLQNHLRNSTTKGD